MQNKDEHKQKEMGNVYMSCTGLQCLFHACSHWDFSALVSVCAFSCAYSYFTSANQV